jgi:hypothetical protein
MALLVASGINMLIAAASMGLKIDKVRNWNARGRRDIAEGKDTPFARWWSAMLVAKASCEANWVSRLNEGAVTDWRAAAFMLERRFHVRWANRPALNKTVEASEVAGKSAQELLIMLQAMKEGRSLSADTSGVPKPYEPPRDRLGRNMEFAGIKDEDE